MHRGCYLLGSRRRSIVVLAMLLAACAPVGPTAPPVSTPSAVSPVTLTQTITPVSTAVGAIPSPTPTATPIPPLELTIHWPERVSALEPVKLVVEVVVPSGVSITPTLRATVLGPGGQPRWLIELPEREGNLYMAREVLQFPLQPPEGQWLLVVSARSWLPVIGERHLAFDPTLQFHDLTAVLPAGADIRVAQDLQEASNWGDQWAGGRTWRYEDGELGLWWAPGPTEPLLLNNAVVMLEATYDSTEPPEVVGVEETEWEGQKAFLFQERWAGVSGGTAEGTSPRYWD